VPVRRAYVRTERAWDGRVDAGEASERVGRAEGEGRRDDEWRGKREGMRGDRRCCVTFRSGIGYGGERELGQGKTTLNPHSQPRGAISANQDPKAMRRHPPVLWIIYLRSQK